MGLFGSIFESVINEIKADDAYTRFYSSMPREDFDTITGGEENIDKFIQFFLNCVRDGKSTTTEATNAIKLYSRADQLVKNKIKTKVNNGEYEDADDVISDAKYLSSGGAVLSRKKFAKEGYIKLGENDRWLCTCTTNYCANNHYYGDSHWCTASDRMGRYDGYHYFKQYSVRRDCALIQYKWKGQTSSGTTITGNFAEDKGYVGDIIPKQYSMFQIQVDGEGEFGQICDFEDYSRTAEELSEFVGPDMYSILKDEEKLKVCIRKTAEQNEIEEPYQAAIYESLKKKKEKRERELAAKRMRLETQCQEIRARKLEMIKENWQKFSEKVALKDYEAVYEIFTRDVVRRDTLNEEDIKKTYYCRAFRKTSVRSNAFIISICPVWGVLSYVDRTYLSNGLEDFVIETSFYDSTPFKAGMAFVVRMTNGNLEIVKEFGPYDDRIYVFSINNLGSDYTSVSRFFEINGESDRVRIIYDSKTDETFEIGFESDVIGIGDGKYVFLDGSNDSFRKFLIFDENTHGVDRGEDGTLCYKMYYTTGIGLIKPKLGYQLIYCPGYEIFGAKFDTLDPVEEISSVEEGNDDKFYVSFESSKQPVNMYSKSEGDFVFGIFGNDVWSEDGNDYLRYREKVKLRNDGQRSIVLMRLVHKQDGSYAKFVDNGTRKEIPCDKYGRTEKDIIGSKNLKAWQDAGGHSPEAKAQMDKMWADRQDSENNGSKAMSAWDDNDVRRDLGMPGTTTADIANQDPRFASQQMKDSMKDPRWKGTIGLKDPEGFLGYSAGYKTQATPRPNPFYRIGVNGKPLDQPWYDEDEVPARFSEYPEELEEAVNKIKSLFNRMGLLED